MAIKEEFDVLTRKSSALKEPKRYWVIMHNDDYTTQEFVVYVLEKYFHKNSSEAHQLMMAVHLQGKAFVGLFTKDIAETKTHQVMQHAREKGMPLKLSIQPEA